MVGSAYRQGKFEPSLDDAWILWNSNLEDLPVEDFSEAMKALMKEDTYVKLRDRRIDIYNHLGQIMKQSNSQDRCKGMLRRLKESSEDLAVYVFKSLLRYIYTKDNMKSLANTLAVKKLDELTAEEKLLYADLGRRMRIFSFLADVIEDSLLDIRSSFQKIDANHYFAGADGITAALGQFRSVMDAFNSDFQDDEERLMFANEADNIRDKIHELCEKRTDIFARNIARKRNRKKKNVKL